MPFLSSHSFRVGASTDEFLQKHEVSGRWFDTVDSANVGKQLILQRSCAKCVTSMFTTPSLSESAETATGMLQVSRRTRWQQHMGTHDNCSHRSGAISDLERGCFRIVINFVLNRRVLTEDFCSILFTRNCEERKVRTSERTTIPDLVGARFAGKTLKKIDAMSSG